jgi:hypothetical protein
MRWIAINAGYDGDEVLARVAELPLGHGFNALTGQYGDMFAEAVIDPLKVTRAALESAASIAALLITNETAVVEEILGNPGAIMARASAISPRAGTGRPTSTDRTDAAVLTGRRSRAAPRRSPAEGPSPAPTTSGPAAASQGPRRSAIVHDFP